MDMGHGVLLELRFTRSTAKRLCGNGHAAPVGSVALRSVSRPWTLDVVPESALQCILMVEQTFALIYVNALANDESLS
jgi:hypothetical protein